MGVRVATGLCVAVLALCACAGRPVSRVPVKSAQPPKAVVVVPQARDRRGFLRFHMTQSGRQMTADQFDAWMKANGIRVAKGRPPPVDH